MKWKILLIFHAKIKASVLGRHYVKSFYGDKAVSSSDLEVVLWTFTLLAFKIISGEEENEVLQLVWMCHRDIANVKLVRKKKVAAGRLWLVPPDCVQACVHFNEERSSLFTLLCFADCSQGFLLDLDWRVWLEAIPIQQELKRNVVFPTKCLLHFVLCVKLEAFWIFCQVPSKISTSKKA